MQCVGKEEKVKKGECFMYAGVFKYIQKSLMPLGERAFFFSSPNQRLSIFVLMSIEAFLDYKKGIIDV